MAQRRNDFEISVVLKGLLSAYAASVVGAIFLMPHPYSFLFAVFGLIYSLLPGVFGLPILYLFTRGTTLSIANLFPVYLLYGCLLGLICYLLPFTIRSVGRPYYLSLFEFKRDVLSIVGLFAVPGIVGGIVFWALVQTNIRQYRLASDAEN